MRRIPLLRFLFGSLVILSTLVVAMWSVQSLHILSITGGASVGQQDVVVDVTKMEEYREERAQLVSRHGPSRRPGESTYDSGGDRAGASRSAIERKDMHNLGTYHQNIQIDCRKILVGDPQELSRAEWIEKQSVNLTSDQQVQREAQRCAAFTQTFITQPLTQLEASFPLAYNIITYKQASQVVDLLRAIYRPQNSYCIHVDHKSSTAFRSSMETVSQCFPNVIMASRSIDVRWGRSSVLEPEIVCMEDLWRFNRTWRYLINLTGQEFPLRTNYELVQILGGLKGANLVAGYPPNQETINRWRKFLPAPHGIRVLKGAVHVVLTRKFVDYVLHNQVAQTFLNWTRQTPHNCEHFFNSLNHNPHLKAPGAYKIDVTSGKRKPYFVRYKNWFRQMPCPCNLVVRGICILCAQDLPRLNQRRELFANKFFAGRSRVAIQCLAESIRNRSLDEASGTVQFDLSFYRAMDFVNHVFPS